LATLDLTHLDNHHPTRRRVVEVIEHTEVHGCAGYNRVR